MRRYRILGVIPARGGSKPIPKQNIKSLLGRPLIAYTIVPARECKLLTRLVVSSEDEEVLEVARNYGAEVPFVRPKELADDLSLLTDVVKHAVLEVEKQEGKKYDYVVVLSPTTPLRTTADIDRALRKLIETGADSVISVTKVGSCHPMRMKKIVHDRLIDYVEEEVENMPKKLLPPVYLRNEAIYAVRRDVLVNQNSFKGRISCPYLMPPERSITIDTKMDFQLAEAVMKRMKWKHIKPVVSRRRLLLKKLIRRKG
ncbi:MAG: acylneuraminate cytidylyltransferase family protein [Candidatus Hadarchaeum sp.]